MLNAIRHSRRRGIAALEFAFVAPFFVMTMIGIYDTTRAVIIKQEVYNAAHSIPLTASILAVQADKSTSLYDTQTMQTMSALYIEAPLIRAGIENGPRSVTMTSVTFIQTDSATCTPSPTTVCNFTANVAWSAAYADPATRFPNTFTSVRRACGTLTQVAPTAVVPGLLTQLGTAGIHFVDPILVVDVHYRYTPLFFNFITGSVDFWASGYWPVRSGKVSTTEAQQYTTLVTSGQLTSPQSNGITVCPGYT